MPNWKPLTKQERIIDLEEQLDALAQGHESELEKLSEISDQVAEVVRKAGARAAKSKQRADSVRK
eukprot:2651988-Prymnesium_polylepis.1